MPRPLHQPALIWTSCPTSRSSQTNALAVVTLPVSGRRLRAPVSDSSTPDARCAREALQLFGKFNIGDSLPPESRDLPGARRRFPKRRIPLARFLPVSPTTAMRSDLIRIRIVHPDTGASHPRRKKDQRIPVPAHRLRTRPLPSIGSTSRGASTKNTHVPVEDAGTAAGIPGEPKHDGEAARAGPCDGRGR